jgi:hypothetical protein
MLEQQVNKLSTSPNLQVGAIGIFEFFDSCQVFY